MGQALIAFSYMIDNEPYDHVYAARSEASGVTAGLFTEADWLRWTNNQPSLAGIEAATDGEAVTYDGSFGLVGALLKYLRMLTFDQVNFFNIFSADGLKNDLSSVHVSVPINAQGLGARQIGGDDPLAMAGANQTVQVNKGSSIFGKRGGRNFIRGMLHKDDIQIGGRNGVQLTSTGLAAVIAAHNGALIRSDLARYFAQGDLTEFGFLSIPHYYTKTEVDFNPDLAGVLKDTSAVNAMAVKGVTPRQANRGRRKPSS